MRSATTETGRLARLFAISFLLVGASWMAGCTDPSPNDSPCALDDCLNVLNETEPRSLEQGHLEAAPTVIVLDRTSYSDGEKGGNCVIFRTEFTGHVWNASFVADWNPTTPNEQELTFHVRDFMNPEAQLEVSGPPPLTLEFNEWNVTHSLTVYVAPSSNPGAFHELPLRLEWSFEHRWPDLRPSEANCA